MSIILRLTRMAFHYRGRISLAYLALLGGAAAQLVIPELLGTAIDELRLLGDADRQLIVILGIVIVCAYMLRGLLEYVRLFNSELVSQRVSYDLRNSLYNSYQRLSFAYHDTEHTGNLMSKATADVDGVRRYISMGLVRSADIVLLVVATSILMFRLNWELALISLAFVPFLALRSSVVMRKLRELWTGVQVLMGEMVTVLQENLSGISVVKSFAAEEYEKERFARKTAELAQQGYLADKQEGSNSAVMTFFFTLVTGFILWYGGRQVINDPNFTVGELVSFLVYMSMLQLPVRMTAFTVNSFSRAISSGERIFQVLDAESAIVEKPDALELPRTKGAVRFRDVSFGYNEVTPVVNGVDIDTKPGQVTAVLGAPGSGKTTLVHLIPRFYDVSRGSVTIDDVDVRDVSLESLRRNVGIVQQDVFLFGASIKENISYGVADATHDDIVHAARVAQLHEFIMGLPDGYDTPVGEQGHTLSGGQRQRLAIARTILVNPPVLILDDSTSSVDVETERQIRRALAEVITGRTTFVIAHRLSTVRGADLILVMKDGQIAEQGTHQELMARGEMYRDIYELQLRPQEEVILDATLETPAVAGAVPMPAGDDGDGA